MKLSVAIIKQGGNNFNEYKIFLKEGRTLNYEKANFN